MEICESYARYVWRTSRDARLADSGEKPETTTDVIIGGVTVDLSKSLRSRRKGWTFDDYVVPGPGECRSWFTLRDGEYGTFRGEPCQRIAYRRAHPDECIEGFEIHHKCRNTRCVNPDHLQKLTSEEHVQAHVVLNREDAMQKNILTMHNRSTLPHNDLDVS